MSLTRFNGLDTYSRAALRRLASNWRESPQRPLVTGEDALAWHGLLQDWVRDRRMPLLVRRPECGRGRELAHPSGRVLVPVDGAPAVYLLSLAMEQRRPDKEGLQRALEEGRMPVAESLKASELRQARYTGTTARMDAANLGELGYAVRHVAQIGMRRVPLEERVEEELAAHSLLLLSPVNMFVVPKEYAGVSELAEFVEEMDDARSFAVRA